MTNKTQDVIDPKSGDWHSMRIVDLNDTSFAFAVSDFNGSGTLGGMTIQTGQKSGQLTGTAAGVAIWLNQNFPFNDSLLVKAFTTNTGLVYVGNDNSGASGTVTANTGIPLAAGDVWLWNFVTNLNKIYVRPVVAGEGLAWSAGDI